VAIAGCEGGIATGRIPRQHLPQHPQRGTGNAMSVLIILIGGIQGRDKQIYQGFHENEHALQPCSHQRHLFSKCFSVSLYTRRVIQLLHPDRFISVEHFFLGAILLRRSAGLGEKCHRRRATTPQGRKQGLATIESTAATWQ
jgi:hypothetical protein